MNGMSSYRRRLMAGAYPKELPNYLCFTALESGTFTLSVPAAVNSFVFVDYSIDGGATWVRTTKSSGTALTVTTPTVNIGDSVLWRADNNGSSYNNYPKFSSSGKFEVSGDVESMHTYNSFSKISKITRNYTATCLFQDCVNLVSAENLILKDVAANAIFSYRAMFERCTSLITPPSFENITNAGNSCFYYTFSGCTSLTSAQSLRHVNIVGSVAFAGMFNGCTSLTIAPNLPQTDTLTNECFAEMFKDCTSLTTVPATLPAMNLANGCYRSMFENCSNLTIPPNLPAIVLASNCYVRMFKKSGIVESPVLPAGTLVNSCYLEMFRECPSINKITMLATDISASNCMKYFSLWVGQSSGVFVKNSQTNIPTGFDGIPSGWTVINV